MLSLQAPSHGFKQEGEKEMKGWMHCGFWKKLASPQLTGVDNCVFSILIMETWRQTPSSPIKSNWVLSMWHTNRCGNYSQENICDILQYQDTGVFGKKIFTGYLQGKGLSIPVCAVLVPSVVLFKSNIKQTTDKCWNTPFFYVLCLSLITF